MYVSVFSRAFGVTSVRISPIERVGSWMLPVQFSGNRLIDSMHRSIARS